MYNRQNMNYKISFRERAALAMINLSKQKPITLEEMRAQVKWLKENSKTKERKRRKA